VNRSHIVGNYEFYDLIKCTLMLIVGCVAMVTILMIVNVCGSLLLVQLVYHKLCVLVL